MKERPILYSTPMIQAKLAGQKTQTRRLKDLEEVNHNPNDWKVISTQIIAKDNGDFKFGVFFTDGDEGRWIQCPYGQAGDVLWSRETFSKIHYEGVDPKPSYLYKTDDTVGVTGIWKPSIHMPKEAARIWERITDIRVERLQDISEADAIAEGIQPLLASSAQLAEHGRLYKHYTEHREGLFGTGLQPVKSYETLWESINGEGSWNLNPWVWVLESEVLSTTGRPSDL